MRPVTLCTLLIAAFERGPIVVGAGLFQVEGPVNMCRNT
jgi:hypothetical protein